MSQLEHLWRMPGESSIKVFANGATATEGGSLGGMDEDGRMDTRGGSGLAGGAVVSEKEKGAGVAAGAERWRLRIVGLLVSVGIDADVARAGGVREGALEISFMRARMLMEAQWLKDAWKKEMTVA